MSQLCECGCGREVKSGSRFIRGHNRKGKSSPKNAEHRRKISMKLLGRKLSLNTIQKISQALRGRKHSDEAKAKMSRKAKGRKPSRKAIENSIKSRRIRAEKNRPKPQLCECGCGNYANLGCRFICNHAWVGRKHTKKSIEKISRNSVGNKGRKFSIDHRRRIGEANRGKLIGENHPNWKGGVACEPYCDVWLDKEFKENIKKRDNYECQNPDCWGTTSRLCLHHINYDKKDCRLWNIITVCLSCNSRANRNREYWTSLYRDIIKGGIYA